MTIVQLNQINLKPEVQGLEPVSPAEYRTLAMKPLELLLNKDKVIIPSAAKNPKAIRRESCAIDPP